MNPLNDFRQKIIKLSGSERNLFVHLIVAFLSLCLVIHAKIQFQNTQFFSIHRLEYKVGFWSPNACLFSAMSTIWEESHPLEENVFHANLPKDYVRCESVRCSTALSSKIFNRQIQGTLL